MKIIGPLSFVINALFRVKIFKFCRHIYQQYLEQIIFSIVEKNQVFYTPTWYSNIFFTQALFVELDY